MIYPNSIFVPLTVHSIHLSEVFSFHLLRQDGMCPALKLSFDVPKDSLTSLTSVSEYAGIFAVLILGVRLVQLVLLLSVTLMLRVRLTLHVPLSSS